MAVSSLAGAFYPADGGNYTAGRQAPITKITIHHMAGVMSAEQCGRVFQTPGRGGSAHYGIGVDGDIAGYVDEDNTAWTDSNWASNSTSVTIENSNSSTGGDWPVSDATFNSLIRLVADIAKRNALGMLVPGQNLTWHNMYVATTCPGPYLQSRMQEIANRANEINQVAPAPAPAPAPAQGGFNIGDKVLPRDWVDYYGTRLLQTREFYYINSISGNRAVLSADSPNGAIYAAMNTDNLTKVGETPSEPTPTIGVGSTVLPIDWVDYNGVGLIKTRAAYFVSEIYGDRAVLRADSMNGPVYAAVNVNNLRLV